MWYFIDQLRQKPKRAKDQIAFIGASMITGCIALVWLVSLQAQEVVTLPTESIETIEESRGAFAQFFGAARQQLGAVFTVAEEVGEAAVPSTTTLPAAATSSVVVPQITPETARRLNPTPILIGTSSPTASTSGE